jgi:serine/threonine-protein kinase
VDLLDRASEELETQFAGLPQAQLDARLRLGKTYYNLGLMEESEREYRRALALAESEYGPDDARTADAQVSLSGTRRYFADFAGSDSLISLAIPTLERELGNDTRTALAYSELATTRYELRQDSLAMEANRRALAIHEAVSPEGSAEVASSLNNLGATLYGMGQKEEGTRLFERSAEMSRRLGDENGMELGGTLANLGAAYNGLERFDDAVRVTRESVSIMRETLGEDHQSTGFALSNFGAILNNADEHEEAAEALKEAIAIYARVLPPDHPTHGYPLLNLGNTYLDLGRYDEAERLILQARGLFEKHFGTEHRAFERTTEALDELAAARASAE